MPSEPRLVLLDGFTPARQALPLETYPFVIGRARECHFVVDHSQVSRLHARLELDHEQITLIDLNSTNGTYVNGERMLPGQPRRLRAGDKIDFGHSCTVEFDDPGTTAQMLAVQLPTIGLALDEDGAQVMVNGKQLQPPLSPGQFTLLLLLAKHEGCVVTREDLRAYVWGPDEAVTDQTIDALVSRLRKRLDEADPEHEYVVTRRGFGLMFRNRQGGCFGGKTPSFASV
jgi:FHA domain/Transcriptional regulatory protein, C terminal